MMGDPGTSDSKLLYPTLGTQQREEFHVPAPGSALAPSEPSFSNSLDGQYPLFSPSLHYHPAVSLRGAGFGAWSNRDFEGGSVGPRKFAQDPIQSRSSHPEDTSDVMARARVGEDDLLTFPEGEDDAVTITARDVASLQPGKFLTDNIVDFYIKYLKANAISPKHQNQFHFFNSFFFPRLLETTASLGVNECRVDYVHLRKWIGDVNLFEKDFVFVPVVVSSHWSLIVICHLQSLNPSSHGERKGSPCILHLDPMEGKHECFEGQVKSFIFEAWVKRFEASKHLDILHSLLQMKYVQAKVPQQGNGYDCGLYILHYMEVFFSKLALEDLNVCLSQGGGHFTRPNFRVEVLDKRNCIQRIISHLRGMFTIDDVNFLGIQPMPQDRDGLVHCPRNQQRGSPKRVKETKSKKWKEKETLILLECVVGGGRFSKGKLGAMHWDLIAEEINRENGSGSLRSKEQCQNRFDTLLKAYKDLNAYCVMKRKEFCQVTEDEKRSLKLATPLGKGHEDWYNHLHSIYNCRASLRDQSHKRSKPNVDGDVDVNKLASSPFHLLQQCPPPLDVIGSSKTAKPSSRQVFVKKFNESNVALRYTFLNLIQVGSLRGMKFHLSPYEELNLEFVCRRLAIVQDQMPLEIRKQVFQLQDLKLLRLEDLDHEMPENCWMDENCVINLEFGVYKKIRRKVLNKNPHLNTFRTISHIDMFSITLFSPQHVRVLNLYHCLRLETLELGDFPCLCCLDIIHCKKLKVVNGWEAVKGLGWIIITGCPCYCNLPDVHFLSSLKEFYFENWGEPMIPWQLANFSQCFQLRMLQIDDDDLVESMDLKALRFLEVLSFSCCTSLSTIHGLSGLQSLKKLILSYCVSLKVIPDLGCLKALTYLNMDSSGIIEIPGVEELHLLTSLELDRCKSLELLPPLDHLKALEYLGIHSTSVEEIPGVEHLVNLVTLQCNNSKLKQLPNLDHL